MVEEHLGTRKLIKFGTNSHVISIPKNWLETNKLKKGDELFVKMKPNEISFLVKESTNPRKIERINCDKINVWSMETKIISSYKANYDTIIFEGKELQKYAKEIKNILQRLPGIEIIEQSSNKIIAKDLIDINQITVSSMINRMDMLARSMFQDLVKDNPVKQLILKERDKELNRLNYLLTRTLRMAIETPIIASKLKTSTLEAYHVEKINWVLEKIGDYLKRIAGDIQRAKKDEKMIVLNLKDVYQKYLGTMKAYYKKDKETAVNIESRIRQSLKQITKLVISAEENNQMLAYENLKNILRDLKVINRSTIELN